MNPSGPGPASADARAAPSGTLGQGDVFWSWVETNWDMMSGVASRLVPASDHQDVLQDALTTAWRRRDSFDAERGSFRTWLVIITVDQAKKSRRRTWRLPHLWSSTPEVPASDAGRDVQIDLEKAIAALPSRQRLAVSLHYFAGLSVVEVAQVMRCAEGTVKSTLSDARSKLKDILGKDYR
jgi:RNA polymerase sigma factor (sigma-70 family)